MGKGIDISVLGVPELDKLLHALPIAMEKKIVRRAIRKGMKLVLVSAQAKCPVKSGKLKASLKVRSSTGRGGRTIGAAVVTGSREQLGIDAKDPYYYPMAVETGHRGAPAQPFLRPALAENEEQSLSIIRSEIASGLGVEGA